MLHAHNLSCYLITELEGNALAKISESLQNLEQFLNLMSSPGKNYYFVLSCTKKNLHWLYNIIMLLYTASLSLIVIESGNTTLAEISERLGELESSLADVHTLTIINTCILCLLIIAFLLNYACIVYSHRKTRRINQG